MKLFQYLIILFVFCGFVSCSDDDDSSLKNDLIKKTTAPAIVGEKIEFAYAMGAQTGKLQTAEARASIAGAQGTGFELFSYYTTRTTIQIDGVNYTAGNEVPVRSVRETNTSGAISSATMEDQIDEIYINPTVAHGKNKVDLIAATVRYAYVVPEEARGKNISFSFSSKSTTGETASYSTPEYPVSKMDMKRLIVMTSGDVCYFSIANMAAYTKEQVESQNLSDKIDFVYIHKDKLGDFNYGHSFVSLGTDSKYIATPEVIPSNWAKTKTPMEARRDNVRDAQLKGSMPAVYLDDIDFQTLNLNEAVDYTLGLNTDGGAFMKTADGKYAAYIYVNKIAAGTMTVSIKRYPL